MKHRTSYAVLPFFFFLFFSSSLCLAKISVKVGPPATGNGGTNPMSIPPANPVEYDITWVTDSNREWTFSIVPGWLYGRRFQLDKAYFFFRRRACGQ